MAHLKNRRPIYLTDHSNKHAPGCRFDMLSKSDWADAFCDLYLQVFGESASPEEMIADAESRIKLHKLNGLRRG